jgi:hypothetical protein
MLHSVFLQSPFSKLHTNSGCGDADPWWKGVPAMTAKWKIFRLIRSRSEGNGTGQDRNREPLDHPEIARMTLQELADLPLPRET